MTNLTIITSNKSKLDETPNNDKITKIKEVKENTNKILNGFQENTNEQLNEIKKKQDMKLGPTKTFKY